MKKEKTPQSFSKVCRNIFVLAAAVLVIVSVLLIMQIIALTGLAPFITYSGNRLEFIPDVIEETAIIIAANYARIIFGKLRKSDTPFLDGIPQKLKVIACALVIGGGAHFFAMFLVVGLSPYYSLPEASVSLDGISMMITGSLVWGISYIFGRGFMLQQESDETI